MLASSANTSHLQASLLASLGDDGHLLEQVAIIKRFVELYLADQDLREAFHADPRPLANLHGVPPELAGYLIHQQALADADHPALRAYGSYLEQRLAHRDLMRLQCRPTQGRFQAWRDRQIKRCQGQLRAQYNQAILHLPVAFELSSGCSVGCWFCGLSAARLETVFQASQANRKLWRESLEAVREVAGPAAGRGIAFWATDPLDNPDYELLCTDFHSVLGRFPATTTALGAKDPKRAQRLLELSWAHGCEFNRFSILSLNQMKTLTAHFSPMALLYVDLIAQTRGALRAKALAGRTLRSSSKSPSPVSSEPSTIACVSGFLISMPAGTVRLISPCAASQRWPEGYRVHATASFSEAGQLRLEMAKMMEQYMPESQPMDRPLALRAGVIGNQLGRFPLPELARRRLAEGTSSGIALALELESVGVPMAQTFHAVGRLFDEGFLDDEPEGKAYG